MATIRPSIYIGIGGTGILAISKTKKMYEDAYGKGKIPEQIAFAAIDFDLTAENDPNLATDMKDDFLSLKNLSSPKQLYNVRSEQGEYSWMFGANTRFIGDRISDGASQVRTYGRFLTEMIKDSIDRRIADCVTQVKNIQNSFEHDEEKNQPIDVHIAISLAGGTGCGSFLNVAQLIRDKYQNQVNIIGYGVIHSVFRTMDPSTNKSPRVVANAYSAILDLDYLMGASNDNPIKVTLNGSIKELKSPLYDEFYVIDNETENGKRVDNIKKLCEVVGTCLYVAGGEMGSKVKSGQSNTGWKNGNFNISPKLGWVQSLGACQVVYKGDLLAEIYGLKAAIEVIRKLQYKDADIQQKAVNWTEKASVREDGDQYNLLIDSIYTPKKINSVKLPLPDIKDSITEIKAAINKYIHTLPEFPGEKDLASKSNDIVAELKKEVSTLLHAENGVGNVLEFLSSLDKILNQFKGEMETESVVFDKKWQDALSALDSKNYIEYEDYTKKLFKTKSGQEERLTELIARPAQKILKDKLETERRKAAYIIFTNIIATVAELKKHVEEINKKLTSLLNDYQMELTSKQNSSESTLVFEYDLSYNDRLTMDFDSRDVVISDYIASLGKSIYEVDIKKDLDNTIRIFASRLKKADEYRNKLIVDVIADLSEEEYKRLKKEITEKSSRLLRLEDRGQMNKTRNNALATSMLVQNYLISIYNSRDDSGNAIKSRLENDGAFLRDIKKDFVQSDFASMKQKIIFYRSDMAIIPYCIGSFDDITVDREYNVLIQDALTDGSTSFNPHFDKNLFREMKLKDFKLKPEMQNEAELYWICGSVFGWQSIKETKYIMQKDNNGIPQKIEGKEESEHTKYIRVNKGKYFYWNEDGESKGLEGKWVSLNNTTQRDQAFQFFKTVALPQIKQTLQAKIKSDIKAKGKAYYEAIVDGIIANGKYDYIDQIVCADKNSLTYYTQAKGEDKRFDEEWKYIEKQLKNALSNF
ncbi:MAG: tubulin-like doman-containing protein [Dysgonamonadaceae bacterium]|jgi:hypothetical protein|nr:tubulin-like doman-containing protein [Dysgonamonadaceae bacterium]